MTKGLVAALSLILLGIATLIVASLIPTLLPTHVFWSSEQAREQATAASRLHQVQGRWALTQQSTTASEADRIHAQQELEAARARFDASREALARAQFWNRRVPSLLRWTGGALTLLGVLAYFATKYDSN